MSPGGRGSKAPMFLSTVIIIWSGLPTTPLDFNRWSRAHMKLHAPNNRISITATLSISDHFYILLKGRPM